MSNFCTISDGAIVDDSGGAVSLGVGAFIGHNAVVMSRAVIGPRACVGAGSVIYPGVTVGDGAVVDPGCVVKSDIPAHSHVTCQGVSATGPTKDLGELVQDLHDYAKTHNHSFRSRRWEIANRLLNYINAMALDEWCQLYEMALMLLWEGQETDESALIRRNFIDPATAHFIPQPTKNCAGGHRVAWLIKHAAGGSYTPFKRVMEYLRHSLPCDVFVHGSVRDKEVKAIIDCGHEVFHFSGPMSERVHDIREACEKREVETLICDVPTSIPTAVYLMRSAPRQVFLSPGFRGMPCDIEIIPFPDIIEVIGDAVSPWFSLGVTGDPIGDGKAATKALYREIL